jgi:hypothetical protein
LEWDDDGPRIAEDAADAVERDETGEAIEIAESGEIGHASIVMVFRRPEKAKTATNSRGFGRSPVKNHPLKNAKPPLRTPTMAMSFQTNWHYSCPIITILAI